MGRRRGDFAPVRITDVAHAAGVAPMTVSRVLNTPERVSAATADRVRAAIDRLGYVPNLIAGGLSSRRSRMIAAIVPSIASPMFNEPVQLFTDCMNQAGYHVLLGLSGYADHGTECRLLRAVLARRPDGLLLTGTSHSAEMARLLHDARIPVVEIWDVADQPTDILVGFDHTEVGAAVAAYLAGRGYGRFALVSATDTRAARRRQGFLAELQRIGGTLVSDAEVPAPSAIVHGRAALSAMLPVLDKPTALFCSSDLIAFGAVTEARMHGIAIPERLAVCGFGDFELSRASEPAITSVGVDGRAVGRLAAENLLGRFSGKDIPVRTVVPFHILPRATT